MNLVRIDILDVTSLFQKPGMQHIHQDAMQVAEAARSGMLWLVFEGRKQELGGAAVFTFRERHDLVIGRFFFSGDANGQLGQIQATDLTAVLAMLLYLVRGYFLDSHGLPHAIAV